MFRFNPSIITLVGILGTVRFAEAELETSCAVDPIMIPFWSWRVPTLKEALRLRHEEHRRQAEVVRNMDEQLISYEESERASEKRGGGEEEQREKEKPPQQQQRDPSKAKYEPQLVDLLGAGGEGAGEQLLLQRQQHPQPPRPQEVLQSEDCRPCRE